jgi:hypothetical protein
MDALMRQIAQEGYKRTPPISLYLRKPALHPSDIVRKSLSGRHLETGGNLLDRAERSSPEAA